MRRTYSKTFFFLVCITNILLFSATFPESALPEALQMDLKRVEETWRILDKYAEQAWAGWKRYSEIPFRLEYPNGLSLQIGEPKPIGKFKLIEDITLRGKKIYLDDSRLNSLIISPLLDLIGGGGSVGKGHPTISVNRDIITKERKNFADSLIKSLGNPSFFPEIVYSTDNAIFVFIHELFHCFTDFGAMYYSSDQLFDPDLNYATFSEIEGDLLEKAAFETNTDSIKLFLEEAYIVRDMKTHNMTEVQRKYESDREKCEGTAEYATYRVVQLMKNDYEPGLSQNEDPQYYGFRYCDYFLAMKQNNYHKTRKNTLLANSKCYENGFYKCLILDKLMPNWKVGFFENEKSFDQLFAQLGCLKEGTKSNLLETIKKEYQYDKLVRYHAPVIVARDSVIKYFQDPNMRFYVINFKKMVLSTFPNITSSGTFYFYEHGFQSYYSSGITNVKVGDMIYESKGIPICLDIQSRSIKLPDADCQKDGQNYDLKFSRQEADGIYYNVVITSKNFTMEATKLQVIKSPLQVEFIILPSVK